MPDGGLFKTNKKKYVDSTLKANNRLDFVKRLYEENAPSIQVPGYPHPSTHLMSYDPNSKRVYPTVVRQNGQLNFLGTGDKAYDYADSTGEYIEFPSVEQAKWFANNGYKQGTDVNNNIENGVPMNKDKTMKKRSLQQYGYGGDPKKVSKAPAGYVEDPDYKDPSNPKRKYYKLETTSVAPSRPSPTYHPARKPLNGNGARTPYKPSVSKPRTTTDIDRVYTEPDEVVPQPSSAFRGESVFGTNKHLTGIISYPIKKTGNISSSEGMLNTGEQDADFMYTLPNSSAPDVSRGRYKLSPEVIQKYLGTTNTFQSDNTDLSPYKVDETKSTTKKAMGGWAGGLLDQAPEILNSLMSITNNNAYSRQPIINASSMRNMVSPYAMGGTIDDLDEEELADVQAQADEAGISPEEMLDMLNGQDQQDEESASIDDYLDTEEVPDEEQQPQYEEDQSIPEYGKGGWIAKAVNPKHKGYCTPMTKATCTPHRKALARTFKKHHGFHAMGGKATKVPVEVEGGEVLQVPGKGVMKVSGPKHEDGGVNMNLPEGSKIYSDRLAIDGVDMKDRKLKREARMTKISKLLEDNPHSILLKNTFKRTSQIIKNEDRQDMVLQRAANKIYQTPQAEHTQQEQGEEDEGYAYGGKIRKTYGLGDVLTPRSKSENYGFDPNYGNPGGDTAIMPSSFPSYTGPAYSEPKVPNLPGDLTTGDYVGMIGTAFNSIAPIINTRQNAKATPPAINRYLGVGHDALDTNQRAQDYVASMRTNANTDIETSSNSRYKRNTNSASSVNTQRALDAVTDIGTDKARNAVNDTYSKEMIGLLDKRSNLFNTRDQYQAYGQTQADDRNTANIDNYFTNRGANLVNFGRGVQTIGRNLNISKKNRVDAKLLSQLSLYGLEFDDAGNLINKVKT